MEVRDAFHEATWVQQAALDMVRLSHVWEGLDLHIKLALWPYRTAGPVLDIGCGTGLWSGVFESPDYVGVDRSKAMLLAAVARWGGRKRFVRAEADVLPFADGSFRAAYFCEVLYLVPDLRKPAILSEARRILKTGGALVLVEWTGAGGEKGYCHDAEGWRGLVEPHGFAICRSEGWLHAFDAI